MFLRFQIRPLKVRYLFHHLVLAFLCTPIPFFYVLCLHPLYLRSTLSLITFTMD